MTVRTRRYTRLLPALPGPARLRGRSGLLAFVLALAAAPASVHAQASRFSGEIALASQLVDQGLAITGDTPVVQGAVSWMSPRGWSLGLAGGVEARSPDRPVVVLARISRAWTPSGDWLAQASLLYYDYRGEQGRVAIPDRTHANLYFTYRDTVTFGVSAIRLGDGGDRRMLGAADVDASWPLPRRFSLSAGAGIAQAVLRPRYYYGSYGRRGRVQAYAYGSLGLAWHDGPWRLQLDRNMNSLGDRRAYGTDAPAQWVATASWSF